MNNNKGEQSREESKVSEKAYTVEKVGWGVKYFLVYANTVEEATEAVRGGEGECMDTEYGGSTVRRAKRAPEEDRHAS